MNDGTFIVEDQKLYDVASLRISAFNSRKTRPPEQTERLAERIKRNGFEVTRALWIVERDGFEVFAGGTRLEAARLAGLEKVPCVLFAGLDDDEVARLESEDNENDEYHAPVPLPDVWAECWRLNKRAGWTQARIAEAKGWDRSTVSQRVAWHEGLPTAARKAVLDGLFDEGHLSAISGVVLDVQHLTPWLTTAQAQTELVAEVLGKHRGSTAGIKPTVKVVRETAKRWKEMLRAATEAAAAFMDPTEFVKALVASKARSLGAIERCKSQVVAADAKKKQEAEDEARRALGKAEAAKVESENEARKARERDEFLARCVLGDARIETANCPDGATLLLTDPPYGMNFASGRRKASAKKSEIANDSLDSALSLLGAVVAAALPRMAGNAHLLVFTGWRFEPQFRACLEALGVELRGSLVWVKHNHGTGDLKGAFAPKHERILHFVKGNPTLAKRIPDVITAKDTQDSDHPTEKPAELLVQLVEATTHQGELVLDPFAGSGSALIAADSVGRMFWGCEIEQTWHSKISDKLLAAIKERQP